MNYIKNFQNNIMDKYYKNVYSSFLLNDENENVLIINQNYFNPLLYYSHYLKKYNVNLYILFSNNDYIDKLNNETNYEECSNLLHYNLVSLDQILIEYQNIKFNKIVLLHVKSLEFLEKILDIADFFKVDMYIYISLSIKNKLKLKNSIRSIIKNISKEEFGYVFDYDDIINLLNTYKNFTISNINMVHNNHYITYGSHKSYLFIFKYKST